MDRDELNSIVASLESIAASLEKLSLCVWKNPDGDYKFMVEHSDILNIRDRS